MGYTLALECPERVCGRQAFVQFRLAEEGPQVIWWPQWKIKDLEEQDEAPEVLIAGL